ncbi:hemerythrin domain-containing protein [Armatimonas sp.]|uniref:hemerythrin domain-containing protein n=1 Tax=Armatimonas sp. TaxID=1872638 RepID=UPI00375073BE
MIQLGALPAAGFDEPVRMLSDCHRRIEQFLESFLDVAKNASEHLNAEDRGQLVAALRYFAHSGQLHTSDEDESLFPRLRAHANKLRVQMALETLDHLDRDHQLAHEEHAAAEVLGHRWLSAGHLSGDDRVSLVASLESLQELYRAHILLEETFVFPLAIEVLSPAEITRVGAEMRLRHTGK